MPGRFFPAKNSMSTRLALIGIVVASGLSFLVALIIVATDVWDENAEIQQHTDLVLDTWEQSAAEAAYQLDETLGGRIVNSIGMEGDVSQATITSDLGDVLAAWERAPEAIGFVESSLVGDEPIQRARELFTPQRDAPIGKLEITFSRAKLYEPVVSRAKRTFASAVSQSVLLALALWVVTNRIFTRPLSKFIESLANVNIEKPAALGDRFTAKTMNTELGLLNRTADAILTSTAELLEHKNQAREKLLESEQRFEAFAGAASDWFWETDAGTELVYLSSQYEAVTGFPCASLVGQPFMKCAYPPHGEPPAETIGQLSRALRSRQPFRDIPVETRSADGVELSLCYSGIPQFSEDGQFVGFRGTVRDATPENEWDKHRRFLTESLNHSEKLKMIGQLTAGVAHDFNNLLGAIQANIELLAIGWGDSSQQREAVADAVKRGSLLTKRLLTYSRHQELTPSSFEVAPLVQAVDALLSRLIGEQIDFRCFVEEEIGHCYSDRGQLEAVLINLCINARDAMPEGGKLTVRAEHFTQQDPSSKCLARGEYVCFSVQDTGVGMDQETLAHAAEPFFSTKPVGTGTGLGLAMAVGFADQSHGSLTIDSKLAQGTTVRLYLPAKQSPKAAEPTTSNSAPKLPSELRVLVVEDDPVLQKAIEGHLHSMSCVTICADNGQQALTIAREAKGFDILLIDMVLPGDLSGLQLAERLEELHPSAKKIFMSGYSSDLALNGRLPNGESTGHPLGLLEKPFGRTQLAERIRACHG